MSKIYAYIWGKERKNNYIEFLDDKIIISANVASTRVSACQYDEIRYEDIVDFGRSLETLGYTIRGLMLEYCQWGLCEVIRRYEYAFVLNNGKCIPFEARTYSARSRKRIIELILERSMQGKCIMSNRPRKIFMRALLLTITEIFLYFQMDNVESWFLFVVWFILFFYIIGLYAYAWLAVDDYINITPEYMNAVVSSTEYPFYYREAKKVRWNDIQKYGNTKKIKGKTFRTLKKINFIRNKRKIEKEYVFIMNDGSEVFVDFTNYDESVLNKIRELAGKEFE